MALRTFRVTAKQRESAIITSVTLTPTDGAPVAPWRPGQFLTLSVPRETGRPAPRTYSVCGDCSDLSAYRISVKHERRPHDRPELPDGLGSSYVHERLALGDEVRIVPPRGDFVLDEGSARPVILLAGGVGLTPLVSMLHALARTERHATFVHACENGSVHSHRDEVDALVERSAGRIRAHYVYRTPTEADRQEGRHHSEGFVSRSVLQSLLPIDDYDVYMCGPPAFMDAMFDLLLGLGVREDRIAYEFFGPARPLAARPAAARPAPAPADTLPGAPNRAAAGVLTGADREARPAAAPSRTAAHVPSDALTPASAEGAGGSHAPPTTSLEDEAPGANLLVLDRSKRSIAWREEDGSILEALEAAGLTPDFSCRAGICSTCITKVVEGAFGYVEEPLDPPGDDAVLICCSRPRGRLVLDL